MNPRTILLALACSPSAASAQLMSGKGGLLASHYDTLMKGTAGVNTCVVGDTEPCDLADMPKDETTMVYPGGETRCIFSTSSDFAFQVVPGDTDKLLLFFQGGGACWDEATTDASFCSTSASPNSLSGVFDRSNAANPYKDYTIVHVLYCSGDLHAGNITRPYTDSKGEPVVQVGYYNTRSAVDWAKANLDATLANLVISGCSAGSLGTQAWAAELLDELSYGEAAVVADSYAGIFPNGTQGPLIASYGMCDIPVLEGDLLASCHQATLTIQDVFVDAMESFPAVAFANLNSKADTTQMSFYAAIAATEPVDPGSPYVLTENEYENEVNKVFGRYNEQPNYVSYLVTSTQHCYFPSGITYTADTTGTKGGGAGGQETLADWAAQFPVRPGASVSTECDGEALTEPQWVGHTYCDAAQEGKIYTAP